MSSRSSIEWTATINADGSVTPGATWTPIRARHLETGKVGVHCVKVSPECKNCYAERLNLRNLPHHGTGLPFTVLSEQQVEVFLDEKMVELPLKWKRGRKIFVCSQTDLFGEFVPFALIDQVFAMMTLCPQHTFQVLTKRANRLHQYFKDKRYEAVIDAMRRRGINAAAIRWPLPNVWLGVTAGTQKSADERISALLGVPSAIRFLSAEPLLEELSVSLAGIDWVIAGGESGPGARPSHPDWFRSLRDQCLAAGVPYFFKQVGEWASGEWVLDDRKYPSKIYTGSEWIDCSDDWATEADSGPIVYRIGKQKAGRLLDGQEWSQFPC